MVWTVDLGALAEESHPFFALIILQECQGQADPNFGMAIGVYHSDEKTGVTAALTGSGVVLLELSTCFFFAHCLRLFVSSSFFCRHAH